jgi:hypothetical protein
VGASGAVGARQGHKWWTLAAMCFGLFIALIDVTIVNVALPTIQRDLHAGLSDLQWVSNAYTLNASNQQLRHIFRGDTWSHTAGHRGEHLGACLGKGLG